MIKVKQNYQNQLNLFPLEINSIIPGNHLVRVVNSFVDGISDVLLHKPFSKEGQPPYDPKSMLKIIIYAYSIKLYSSRKIERAVKQDITFMWLSGMLIPDHNTINRFRSTYFKDIMESVFTTMLDYLHTNGYIRFETYFTDGTKIEADANKFSHVWAKNTQRYKSQLQEKVKSILEEIEQINKAEDLQFNRQSLPELGQSAKINSEQLQQTVVELNKELSEKAGISKKITRSLKSKSSKLEKSAQKLAEYEKQEQTLAGRNSYSKTDTDATFMQMKNEEVKPCYNIQVSTENQYVTNTSISQNAADCTDFPQHYQKIEVRGQKYLPNNAVADSAYGSEENYAELDRLEIAGNYLKYNSFHQDIKGGNKNPFHKDHFTYHAETDCYQCPMNKELAFKEEQEQTTKNGYHFKVRIYQCSQCGECEKKNLCTTADHNRSVQRREKFEEYKAQAKANLTSPKGIALRKQRNTDVETFFGDLKQNAGYRRMRLRGKEKVQMEINYLSIAHNMRKVQINQSKTQKKVA